MLIKKTLNKFNYKDCSFELQIRKGSENKTSFLFFVNDFIKDIPAYAKQTFESINFNQNATYTYVIGNRYYDGCSSLSGLSGVDLKELGLQEIYNTYNKMLDSFTVGMETLSEVYAGLLSEIITSDNVVFTTKSGKKEIKMSDFENLGDYTGIDNKQYGNKAYYYEAVFKEIFNNSDKDIVFIEFAYFVSSKNLFHKNNIDTVVALFNAYQQYCLYYELNKLAIHDAIFVYPNVYIMFLLLALFKSEYLFSLNIDSLYYVYKFLLKNYLCTPGFCKEKIYTHNVDINGDVITIHSTNHYEKMKSHYFKLADVDIYFNNRISLYLKLLHNINSVNISNGKKPFKVKLDKTAIQSIKMDILGTLNNISFGSSDRLDKYDIANSLIDDTGFPRNISCTDNIYYNTASDYLKPFKLETLAINTRYGDFSDEYKKELLNYLVESVKDVYYKSKDGYTAYMLNLTEYLCVINKLCKKSTSEEVKQVIESLLPDDNIPMDKFKLDLFALYEILYHGKDLCDGFKTLIKNDLYLSQETYDNNLFNFGSIYYWFAEYFDPDMFYTNKFLDIYRKKLHLAIDCVTNDYIKSTIMMIDKIKSDEDCHSSFNTMIGIVFDVNEKKNYSDYSANALMDEFRNSNHNLLEFVNKLTVSKALLIIAGAHLIFPSIDNLEKCESDYYISMAILCKLYNGHSSDLLKRYALTSMCVGTNADNYVIKREFRRNRNDRNNDPECIIFKAIVKALSEYADDELIEKLFTYAESYRTIFSERELDPKDACVELSKLSESGVNVPNIINATYVYRHLK